MTHIIHIHCSVCEAIKVKNKMELPDLASIRAMSLEEVMKGFLQDFSMGPFYSTPALFRFFPRMSFTSIVFFSTPSPVEKK